MDTVTYRVIKHPVLPDLVREKVTIYFDGKPVQAFAGEPVAAALMAAGYKSFRRTHRRGEPRGLFCAIGRCTDCMMIVDGVPNTRVCVTAVRDGMRAQTQFGLGRVVERDAKAAENNTASEAGAAVGGASAAVSGTVVDAAVAASDTAVGGASAAESGTVVDAAVAASDTAVGGASAAESSEAIGGASAAESGTVVDAAVAASDTAVGRASAAESGETSQE